MKKLIPILLLGLTPACASWFNQPNGEGDTPLPRSEREISSSTFEPEIIKKRVLILKFLNKTTYGGEQLSEHAMQVVRDEVARHPDLVAVTEGEIPGHEDFTGEDSYFNYRTIFEKARANGISAVVTGSIEDLTLEEQGDEIGLFRTRFSTAAATVRFEIHDAGNERTLASKIGAGEVTEEHTRFFGNRVAEVYDANRGKGAVSRALEKTLSDFTALAKKIGWVGRIAKVDLHRYYINAGEATGISLGQLLKVFGEGTPVVDPQTNHTIGIAPGRVKGLLKVIDFLGKDAAVAIVHSGAGFREKDRVEIFSPPRH